MIATIIIGNGIGLALDDAYFKLETGINKAIQNFSTEQQRLIQLGLDQIPTHENELEAHHLILSACKTLSNYQKDKLNWLSYDGKEFPKTYLNFIYQVSEHFFEYEGELPENLVNELCDFVNKCERCHMATLN